MSMKARDYLNFAEHMFETEHLIIRKFEATDAQCLYENHLEEEVKKWIPNESYADIEETQAAIKFYVDCVNNRHLPYVLAVELKETGEFTGDSDLAGYVSDDFGLIADARVLGYQDLWLDKLVACYEKGMIPCGSL